MRKLSIAIGLVVVMDTRWACEIHRIHIRVYLHIVHEVVSVSQRLQMYFQRESLSIYRTIQHIQNLCLSKKFYTKIKYNKIIVTIHNNNNSRNDTDQFFVFYMLIQEPS